MNARQSQISKALRATKGLVAIGKFYNLLTPELKEELKKHKPFSDYSDDDFNVCVEIKKIVDEVVEGEKEIEKIRNEIRKYVSQIESVQLKKRGGLLYCKKDYKEEDEYLKTCDQLESNLNKIIEKYKKLLKEEYKIQKIRINALIKEKKTNI